MDRQRKIRTAIGAGVVTLALAAPAVAWSAHRTDPPPHVAPAAAPVTQEVQYANPYAINDAFRYLDAVAAQQAAAAEEARLWARWGPLHDCEQPGDWYAAGSTAHGYFEGGLGIHHELYKSIAGHSALEDSPVEQMRIADLALARVGRGAWACPIGP